MPTPASAQPSRLPGLVAALWWGSLSTVGFLVVPLLFAHLPTPAMAGAMAARLFAAQTWVSVACCMLLLLISRPKGEVTQYPWARAAIVFIVGGLLWHSVGSVMYLAQWACAFTVLWHTLRSPSTRSG